MKTNTIKPDRKSTRLPGYDYSLPGAYFITIVSHRRECLFGNVVEAEIHNNRYGQIVEKAWTDLRFHYPHLNLGAFIVMPNHVHGIVIINEVEHLVGRSSKAGIPRLGLPEIVRALKSFSARRINELRKMQGSPVWQRSYYDRIIRNESELHDITEYILSNPMNWQEDELRTDA